MIFNISDRLHLITRTVRAGTCNSARGQPCACVHEHARSFDGFPFVRETESKVKKKKKKGSEINGMKQWERPGLRVAAGSVMELGPIKLAKRILGMYRRSKLRFRYYRISFSCSRTGTPFPSFSLSLSFSLNATSITTQLTFIYRFSNWESLNIFFISQRIRYKTLYMLNQKLIASLREITFNMKYRD